MGKVSIVKIKDNIKLTLYKLIGGISTFINTEDVVLLKPNLNDLESYTSPELFSTLIEQLFDHNIKNIFIAESTFGNDKITDIYFKKTGYFNLVKKYKLNIINI